MEDNEKFKQRLYEKLSKSEMELTTEGRGPWWVVAEAIVELHKEVEAHARRLFWMR